MAYDESLAKRIDKIISNKNGFTRKEMFGGVGYLHKGNMCVGVHKNDLIIRYDPKLTAEITTKENVRPFDLSGRAMKGWSLVSSEGIKGKNLDHWVELAFNFTKTLPAKK